MKKASKLGYLLWLPILIWVAIFFTINIVNGDVSITIPSPMDLHRPQLRTLSLWKTETWAQVGVDVENNRLNISHWLIIWQSNGVEGGANYVSIGWWRENYIASVEKSGIWWWNNNKIYSSSSVIWWWSGNSISWDNSQVSAIAWGLSNKTQAWWIIVGWAGNQANGTWVIVWWQNNSVNGDGSLVLWSNSWGWKWSFSWNNSDVQDYSAVIMTSKGTLIWTYEPVTWVNLVVDGAVKVWTNQIEWVAGEIRMQSGCFYAYDGSIWYVINKWLWNECINTNMSCVWDYEELQPGDSVLAWISPISLNCPIEEVTLTCLSNWTFWCIWDACISDITPRWDEYYHVCYDVGVPECGTGITYAGVIAPNVDDLCQLWNHSNVTEWLTGYTWTCSHWGKEVSCSAKRVYSCGEDVPSWNWVNVWSTTYDYWDATESWTYISQDQTPGSCEWTCMDGYHRVEWENDCEGEWSCETSIGDEIMFSNKNKYHVAKINWADGPGQYKRVFKTVEEANLHACSYVCTGGFVFLPASWNKPDRCATCLKWTEVYVNNTLTACSETIDICKDPTLYTYSSERHKCVAYWHCVYDGRPADILPPNSNVGNANEARPQWTNLDWSCVGKNNFAGHQCKYTCNTGSVCSPNGVGCEVVSCNNYRSQGAVVARARKPTGRQDYRQYFFGATSDSDFQFKVKDSAGCYYWCPENRLCKKYGNWDLNDLPATSYNMTYYWKCYSSQQEKEQKCVGTTYVGWWSSPSCGWDRTPTLKWYAKSLTYARGENKTFTAYAEIWGFETHQGGWCLEWCTNDATAVYTGTEYGTICWKKCPDGQYFDYTANLDNNDRYKGGCKPCRSNLQKPNTGDMFLDNPRSCTDKCWPGFTLTFWEEWETCIPTEVDLDGCPEWFTLMENDWVFSCERDVDDIYDIGGDDETHGDGEW